MNKLTLILGTILLSSLASASTVGLSTHPFTMKKQVVTTEFNNYMTNGTGAGITAKYLQRVNEEIAFDAGFGITDGDRSNRLFMGADYAFIPDYGRQPRVSVKGLLETQDFDGNRINSFGAAPTISKGFSFWGKEAFPFMAVPVKVSLNADETFSILLIQKFFDQARSILSRPNMLLSGVAKPNSSITYPYLFPLPIIFIIAVLGYFNFYSIIFLFFCMRLVDIFIFLSTYNVAADYMKLPSFHGYNRFIFIPQLIFLCCIIIFEKTLTIFMLIMLLRSVISLISWHLFSIVKLKTN